MDTELYFLVYHQHDGDIKACLFPNRLVDAGNKYGNMCQRCSNYTATAVLNHLGRAEKGRGPLPWLWGCPATSRLTLNSFWEIKLFTLLTQNLTQNPESYGPEYHLHLHISFLTVYIKKRILLCFSHI